MIRFDAGPPLPALTEQQEQLAARVADMAEEALGLRDPSLISAVCAQLIGNAIGELAVRNHDAIAPMTYAILNDVMQRVDGLTLAKLAIVKAMVAAKRPGH
jgi:hypothetical protein